MDDLWTSLVPLMVGSAILPVQITVTILLLRSDAGRSPAVAWVAGMTLVRAVQGVVFGLVLGEGVGGSDGSAQTGTIASTLLLVVAVLFLASALRKLVNAPDEDAPPPRWMASIGSMSTGRGFLLGVVAVAASAKLWAFTLGALGVIAEADLGRPASIATFVAFVVVAESIHLGLVVLAFVAPGRVAPILERLSDALARYNRPMMIGLGVTFGAWFLYKSLVGFGVV